ncbi:unnamed protein product, partial [Mycena citricolor]
SPKSPKQDGLLGLGPCSLGLELMGLCHARFLNDGLQLSCILHLHLHLQSESESHQQSPLEPASRDSRRSRLCPNDRRV